MTETLPDCAILICSRCRPGDGRSEAGRDLGERLAPYGRAGGFSIEPVSCLAGCARPLTVAFTAPAKATFLFGDIDPARDAGALIEFATLYRGLSDGWCNEGQRPAGLRGKTLARIPHIAGLAR